MVGLVVVDLFVVVDGVGDWLSVEGREKIES